MENDKETFHTPKGSKSVSFGSDSVAGTPAADPTANSTTAGQGGAAGGQEDCDVKLSGSKNGEYIYRYRCPVPGFPRPTLHWTEPDEHGKRQFYYRSYKTNEKILNPCFSHLEVFYSLVNRHLEVPLKLDVDQEVELESGNRYTIRQLMEEGFHILEKEKELETKRKNWEYRDEKRDAEADEEVAKLNKDNPPPYEQTRENIYQDVSEIQEMESKMSTLLLGDQDTTMMDQTTMAPPGYLPSETGTAAGLDQLGARTDRGVQSPTSGHHISAGRGRGRPQTPSKPLKK